MPENEAANGQLLVLGYQHFSCKKQLSHPMAHFTAVGFSFHLPTVSSAQSDIILSARLVITHRYRPSLQDWTLEHVSVGVFTP